MTNTETLEKLVELTTRIDERTERLLAMYNSIEAKLDQHTKQIEDLGNRVGVIEVKAGRVEKCAAHDLRLQAVESAVKSNAMKWGKVVGFTVQIVQAILVAYLLFHLGVK
jgi:predicted  nucleic acid-binding Zn-ribbon protein